MRKDSVLTYVIGYVHGHSDLLRELLFAIERDARKRRRDYRLFFLGNLIDYGPDSKGVIELAIHAVGKHKGSGLLLGASEHRLLQIIDEPDPVEQQKALGSWTLDHRGWATLASYGQSVKATLDLIPRTVDPRHIAFLRKARLYFELENHILVHAGLNPEVALIDQEIEWLLTPGPEFYRSRKAVDKIVVHGTVNVANLVESFPNRIAVNSAVHRNLTLPAVCLGPDGSTEVLASTRFAGQTEVLTAATAQIDWGENLRRPPTRKAD
jgi:serine/threonine protein phosphatase 1